MEDKNEKILFGIDVGGTTVKMGLLPLRENFLISGKYQQEKKMEALIFLTM